MNRTSITQRIPLLIKQLSLIACITLYAIPLMAADENTTQAQKNLPLDVVLVLDSSGSMKRTDPRELRKPAAKLFISLLSEGDRASVVSFSDQGYPVAFFTPVKGANNEKKLFNAVERISNKGVYTNLHGAVQGAMRVIKRDPLPDRKQIIVLMTDGKMDLGAANKNNIHSDKLLNELIPQLKNQHIELHTVAFTDESDKAYLEKIALATGGKFNLAQNDKQLHDVYTAIFEQNKQPNMLPFDGEKFTIDNAIKEVTIVGSKDSKEAALLLHTPDGDMYTAEDKPKDVKWFTSEAFDLITIKKPTIGEWQLKASTGKNKAYIITDLEMQLKIEPQEVAIGEGLMISAWLEDKGKRIEKESVLSALKMKLRVQTPEGEAHELDMKPQPQADGSINMKGVFFNHIALPTAGRYQLVVTANGSTFSRERNIPAKVFDPGKIQAPPIAIAKPEIEKAAPQAETPKVTKAPEVKAEQAVMEKPKEMTATKPSAKEKTEAQEKSPAKEKVKPEAKAESKTDKDGKKAAKQQPKQQPKNTDKEAKQEPEAEGPNLVKATVIFLIINAVFALIGAAVYFVYRMKKKKSAQPKSETSEETPEGEEGDEKKAA